MILFTIGLLLLCLAFWVLTGLEYEGYDAEKGWITKRITFKIWMFLLFLPLFIHPIGAALTILFSAGTIISLMIALIIEKDDVKWVDSCRKII